MRYFDFHTHVLLKQLFSDQPNIDTRISRHDVDFIPQLCTDLPNVLGTQIHQTQLANFADEVMVGVVLYGLESYIAKEVLGLRSLLKKQSEHKMSLALFSRMADTANAPVYRTCEEFTIARTLDTYLSAPLSFNVLNSQSFNQPLPKNRINIFFVIEGCHSLINSANEYIENDPAKVYTAAEVFENLDIILQKARIMSVNLTHIQQSSLSNHAFGMQITKDVPFYPKGNGLTDEGRLVVQGLFDRKISVDVKHMSLKARLDLYNEITAGKYNNVQPVLCTHAGFTGIPIGDYPGYIFTKKSRGDVVFLEIAKTMHTKNSPVKPGAPAFNSTTINLFDEEIVWIVQHGGVIGLSMDRRIIGYVDIHDRFPSGRSSGSLLIVDKEYISVKEWESLRLANKKRGAFISEDDCLTIDELEINTETSIPSRDEYFFDHVLLHLKHFLQVCFNAGIAITTAQKHITIGSDFDGMINPFINMPTVEQMPALKKYIQMNFRFYLEMLTDSRQWADQLDVNAFAEDLFYLNGFNYIKTHI